MGARLRAGRLVGLVKLVWEGDTEAQPRVSWSRKMPPPPPLT